MLILLDDEFRDEAKYDLDKLQVACSVYCKQYVYKHIIGFVIRLKYAKPRAQVKQVPF